METVNVVGLDLSTKQIGYAAADGELLSIRGHAKADDPYRRLHELTRELARVMDLRPPRPDLVVIEDYALASPGRLSLIRLGEIGGVTRTRLFELDVRFVLVRPSTLKRFATGNGAADKDRMVARAIKLGARGSVNHDEADAFHLRRMGIAAYGSDRPMYATHERESLDAVQWPRL